MSVKTATLKCRLNPDAKQQAETILSRLSDCHTPPLHHLRREKCLPVQ